jgi:hypothetical protein
VDRPHFIDMGQHGADTLRARLEAFVAELRIKSAACRSRGGPSLGAGITRIVRKPVGKRQSICAKSMTQRDRPDRGTVLPEMPPRFRDRASPPFLSEVSRSLTAASGPAEIVEVRDWRSLWD